MDFVLFMIAIIVSFIAGYWGAWKDCERMYKRNAVAAGAAEYVLDPATGKTTWRWKEKAEDDK